MYYIICYLNFPSNKFHLFPLLFVMFRWTVFLPSALLCYCCSGCRGRCLQTSGARSLFSSAQLLDVNAVKCGPGLVKIPLCDPEAAADHQTKRPVKISWREALLCCLRTAEDYLCSSLLLITAENYRELNSGGKSHSYTGPSCAAGMHAH